jgi:hypothetical protein
MPVVKTLHCQQLFQEKEPVMIATAIYVVNAIRRALDKAGRGLSMLADAFTEAQEFRRAMRRKHRHAEE